MLHLPGFSPREISSLLNVGVLQEHVEDAAKLWRMHERAVKGPLYRLRDLVLLDSRALAHLQALGASGAPGTTLARHALATDDTNAAFVVAYLAFAHAESDAMRQCVQLAVADPVFWHPVAAALAWLEFEEIERWVRMLGRSENPDYRRLAVTVQAAHRRPADEDYKRGALDSTPMLRARAFRAIGETKCLNLESLLEAGLRDADLRCRFWAAWSLALLGDDRAAAMAYEAGAGDPELAGFAIEIAMRAGQPAWARSLVQGLARGNSSPRDAIVAAGTFGDPVVVPWLLSMAEQPSLARAAAEAFATITGVDLEEARFKKDAPDEPPDEHDDDSDLRWPSVDGLSAWWSSEGHGFTPGVRYLAGEPVSESAALRVLRTGYQRQRRAASIEVARLRRDAIVFPTAARADWQKRRLHA